MSNKENSRYNTRSMLLKSASPLFHEQLKINPKLSMGLGAGLGGLIGATYGYTSDSLASLDRKDRTRAAFLKGLEGSLYGAGLGGAYSFLGNMNI